MSTKPDPKFTTGERIRAARLRAGLTQVQLAGRLGVVQHNISALETGRENPSLERLYGLAKAIGCPPSDFDARLSDRA